MYVAHTVYLVNQEKAWKLTKDKYSNITRKDFNVLTMVDYLTDSDFYCTFYDLVKLYPHINKRAAQNSCNNLVKCGYITREIKRTGSQNRSVFKITGVGKLILKEFATQMTALIDDFMYKKPFFSGQHNSWDERDYSIQIVTTRKKQQS